MTFEIKNKTENPLLSRIEYVLLYGFKGASPSKENFKKISAKELKSDESLTIVKNILVKQGKEIADCYVFVYKNKEAMEKIEPKKAETKKEDAEGEATAEQATPEKETKAEEKAEAQPEEKKEEKPEEEGKKE